MALIAQHGVTAIADVRSSPYSKYNPQFNQTALRSSLQGAGISYAFLGEELGARSDDPACYVDGKVQYDRLSHTVLFEKGLERIAEGAEKYILALLCSEKDPLLCHRTILITPRLESTGMHVLHILGSGALEPHKEATLRLLDELKLPEVDLFRTRDDLVREAYVRQGRKIAYVRPDHVSDDDEQESVDHDLHHWVH